MADFQVHLSQAKHNESLANYLVDKPYYDWVITACFYSAIHYFEARLFAMMAEVNNKHSDTSVPLDSEGKQKYSIHRWREELVQNHFPQLIWRSYRKLKENSELARYLTNPSCQELDKPAYSYFQPNDSKKSIESLENIKSGFNIDLTKFLYDLAMDKSNQIQATIIIDKILKNSPSIQDIQNKTNLGFLTKNEISFLEKHIEASRAKKPDL
jgi:hypothetical protein